MKERKDNSPIIMSPGEGAIVRNRGCWSCIHWDNGDKAIQFWQTRRRIDLEYALAISKIDPLKEEADQVVAIRRMVDIVDKSIAQGVFGLCLSGKGQADFTHNAYLCDGWTGKVGSSLATSGTKVDLLPEELKERQEEKLINIKPRKVD